MNGRPEKTLVVETGILCNNRCVFCYENGYRRIPGYVQLVPPDEIRRRIEWGARNGFTTLSVTGGEPTIRRDFIEIVGWARAAGYDHVSVTTNGSRLNDGRFFSECVRAGLDGMGVSIHDMTAAGHDALTGRPGSFAAAVKAIRNGVRAVDMLGGRRFRLNTFTVVNRGNAGHLAEMTDMLAAIGVRLMVLQPPVTGKSNVSPVAELSLSEVVSAVSAAARSGARHGYMVKPFNVPPCMLADVRDGLDMTMYARSSFREHDDSVPGGRSAGDDVGFVRLPACPRCMYQDSCSGLALTLAPVSDLTAAMVRAVASGSGAAQVPGSPAAVWVTGTELLDADGIRAVAAACAPRPAWICTGGTHRIGAGLGSVIAGCGAGIAFVYQARDPGSADRMLCGSDNSGVLLDALRWSVESGAVMPVAVCGAPQQSFIDLLSAMVPLGLAALNPEIRLSLPWRSGDGDDHLVPDVVAYCRRVFGDHARVVIGADPVRPDEYRHRDRLVEMLGSYSDVELDLAMDIPVTPFENRLWSILNWSLLLNFRRTVDNPPGLPIDSVIVEPFT